jgi:glycosyltransferase involved in cell wall biosynthesis
MKIAQVAPLAESVPPKLYGGTERVVSWLTEELVALGHEVTLFASADSRTSGTLAPVWPRALRLSRPRTDPSAAQAVLLHAVAERAHEFDVIHCHLDWIHLPLLQALQAPFLTTLHGRLDLPYLPMMAGKFPNAPFVSISDSQRKPLPGLNWLGTVHHGMPDGILQPAFEPQGYLAFLGRITPEKGPDRAIRIARSAGSRLRIAAKVPRGENQFFIKEVQPLVDGAEVEFIGEVDDVSKAPFLKNATALLFPIDWPEPFGLVMIEAMACGTPVIATPHGSVPEIIEDGVTGFLVNTEAEAIEAVGRVGRLDRRRVRQEFERRFTSRRMAEGYLHYYAKCAGTNGWICDGGPQGGAQT